MTAQQIRDQVQAGIDARLELVPEQSTPWMTELQAAAYTGFTRSALATMRYEHRGPAFSKPGGRIRYHRDDLDAWLREGRQAPKTHRRSA